MTNLDQTRRSLRQRARAGERLCGMLIRMPSEELVEMCAVAGADFVLIDCEHGPADVVALRQHIAAAQVHGVDVIVRVGSGEDPLVLRALDHGAVGIVAPHVDSAEEAQALVAAAHYPPLGHRGFATYGRAGRFGARTAAEHLAAMAEHTLVIGMIESPLAVSRAAGIAAVDGLDGIMIGTADLGAATGPDDPPVADAVRLVNTALVETDTLRMDIVGSATAARAAYDDGAHLVVYNLTATLMTLFADLLAARD